MTPRSSSSTVAVRPDNLALIYQEVLTAIVRVRSNRQSLTDSESFRMHVREALRVAAQDARNRAGYETEDIRMATLAVVGFLDESILVSRNPLFADWPRKPLQEELFGSHMAGELFFQNLEQLLARSDSADLADVLEVHYLCLLLGYRGRYSGRGGGELQGIMAAVANKIRGIRGDPGELSPSWAPGGETLRAVRDPWVRRFAIGAIVCFVLMLALLVTFTAVLNSGASGIRAIASQKKV
jgi:type VI secretion system protein ImpK